LASVSPVRSCGVEEVFPTAPARPPLRSTRVCACSPCQGVSHGSLEGPVHHVVRVRLLCAGDRDPRRYPRPGSEPGQVAVVWGIARGQHLHEYAVRALPATGGPPLPTGPLRLTVLTLSECRLHERIGFGTADG